MPFRLPTSDEKAKYVLSQFNRIAARYDLTNDVISLGLHRAWKRRAVRALCTKPSGRYLDVCCGTGDIAMLIAQTLGFGSVVTGLDFSQTMLNIARSRETTLRQKSGASINWVEGDAQEMPFDDCSFDGAIISFGLRNLTDFSKGIGEMARVVRPGGKVISLDLGHSRLPLFTQLFHVYFHYVVPIIGQVLQNDRQAYTYLPESLRTYPRPKEITKLFQQAQLSDVTYVPLALGSVAMHIGTKYGSY